MKPTLVQPPANEYGRSALARARGRLYHPAPATARATLLNDSSRELACPGQAMPGYECPSHRDHLDEGVLHRSPAVNRFTDKTLALPLLL